MNSNGLHRKVKNGLVPGLNIDKKCLAELLFVQALKQIGFAYSVGANDQDLGAADLRKALCGANDFHRPILTVEPPAASFLISSILPVAR
jgi:hypothetical protein